jgi:RND family efflux transporter MFP subunit
MKFPTVFPFRRAFFPVAASFTLATIGGGTRLARAEERGRPDPTVATAVATREDLFKELTVQAEFRPFQEIDLHAKASGYLLQIDVDMGDVVKAGDLIGVLEVPELEDDLARAMAAEQRAEADFKEAHLNYTRLVSVSRSHANLVAQQDLDAAEAKDSASTAAVAAAKADAKKYRTLASYTRITAPFAGVITKRYADPGALIQAGTASDTQTKPLVRLSQNDRLRLDFPVSAAYADAMKVGDSVEIHLDSRDEPMTGTISRFSRRIAMETRTMQTEVEIPNSDLKLIPGMYATVVLKLQRRPQAIAIPVEAVSGSAHPTVYVVNQKQEIEERPVQLGLETPTKFEVLSGVGEGERVMIGNRSQVHVGEKVSAQPMALLSAR